MRADDKIGKNFLLVKISGYKYYCITIIVISLTGSGDVVREVLTLHPPVDILLLLLSSMSGRREGWEMEEWLASNEPVRSLATNDGEAIIKTKKNVMAHMCNTSSRHHIGV